MTIDQITYFVELANCHTLSQAAINLHISQAGLSRSISQLEAEVGFALFSRSRHGSLLTAKGRQFLQFAEQLLATYHAAQEAARQIGTGKQAEIRIAVCCYLQAINQQFINLQRSGHHFTLRMNELPSSQIINLIKNGLYDLGLIAINTVAKDTLQDLQTKLVTHGHLRLYVPANSQFAKIEQVTVKDLKQMKFVLYEDQYNERLFNLLQLKTGPLNVVFHGGSDWTADYIADDLQACFVGRDFQFNYAGKKLQHSFVPLSLAHLIDDRFDLLWIKRPHYELNPLEQSFLDTDITKIEID